MPKGKKFSAAEKHFFKKEQRLNKEIEWYQSAYKILRSQNSALANQLQLMQSENERLHDWVDRLLEYTELPKEDIKAVCEKDKEIRTAARAVVQLLRPTDGLFEHIGKIQFSDVEGGKEK